MYKIESFTRAPKYCLVYYQYLVSKRKRTNVRFLKNMSRKFSSFWVKSLSYKVWFWVLCEIKSFTRAPKCCLVCYKYLVSKRKGTNVRFLKNMSRKFISFWVKSPSCKVLFWVLCEIKSFTRAPKYCLVCYKYLVSKRQGTNVQLLNNMSRKFISFWVKSPSWKFNSEFSAK